MAAKSAHADVQESENVDPAGADVTFTDVKKRSLQESNAKNVRSSPSRRVKARSVPETGTGVGSRKAAVMNNAGMGALPPNTFGLQIPRVASSCGSNWSALGSEKGAASATILVGASSEGRAGGSANGNSNNAGLMKTALEEVSTAPSGLKPPSLRRNESSNSVLGDVGKSMPILSRSNSFLSQGGRGLNRNNSILSLLGGYPTAGLRESPSTERLLGLDGSEDKLLATLKAAEASNSAAASAANANVATGGTLGDHSLSFGQLDTMALTDLDEPGSVAITLQEDSKWTES